MSVYDLFETRHHVLRYSPEPVDQDLLNDLLWKAWKISPSKNNMMPYAVNILGPQQQAEKDKIYDKVVGNHKKLEVEGLEYNTAANPKLNVEYKFKVNRSYAHVKNNSHLLIFSSRVVPEPNQYYKTIAQREGHFAEQCEHEYVEPIADSVSVEVGFFATHLTGLCREQDIDVSFTSCMPGAVNEWKNIPYLWYDYEEQLA